MAKQQQQTHEPGPGLSTSKAAFDELTKEIARKNEQAHREARKLRTIRDRELIRQRHQRDA